MIALFRNGINGISPSRNMKKKEEKKRNSPSGKKRNFRNKRKTKKEKF
jgi:hypothetical protein